MSDCWRVSRNASPALLSAKICRAPYQPNHTAKLLISNLKLLQYRGFNFDSVFWYKVVYGFSDIPLSEILICPPSTPPPPPVWSTCTFAKTCSSTKKVLHRLQFLVARIRTLLAINIYSAPIPSAFKLPLSHCSRYGYLYKCRFAWIVALRTFGSFTLFMLTHFVWFPTSGR